MRILIVPASKYGSTAEIGRALASTLRDEGFDVDVSQPEHMFNLSPYAAHIVGSALYIGNWLDSAHRFVDEYAEVLQGKPTWLFSSGPLGPAKPKEPIRSDVLEDLKTKTGAVEHQIFNGRLDSSRLSRTERFLARWVEAPEGDFRDWEAIEAWARQIAGTLQPNTNRAVHGS